MADEIDATDEREQFKLDTAIAEIRKKAEIKIEGDGTCLECRAAVKPVKIGEKFITGRWCSVECRNATERNK